MTDERLAEIRSFVERERRGESVSDRYSAARLLDATVYLLDRIEAQREVVEAARRLAERQKREFCDGQVEYERGVDSTFDRLLEALDNLEEDDD